MGRRRGVPDVEPPAPEWAGVSFPELHLRSYVRHDSVPGLYLFGVEVGNRVVAALARRLSGMPYHPAAMRVRPRGTEFRYTSRRRGNDAVRFDATCAPDGEPYRSDPGSFEHWFLTRERLFGRSFDGEVSGPTSPRSRGR